MCTGIIAVKWHDRPFSLEGISSQLSKSINSDNLNCVTDIGYFPCQVSSCINWVALEDWGHKYRNDCTVWFKSHNDPRVHYVLTSSFIINWTHTASAYNVIFYKAIYIFTRWARVIKTRKDLLASKSVCVYWKCACVENNQHILLYLKDQMPHR